MVVNSEGVVTTTCSSNVLQEGAIEVTDDTLWSAILGRENKVRIDEEGNVVELPPRPEPKIIPAISAAQAKVALLHFELLGQVKTLLPTFGEEVQLWYDNASTWERTNPYIQAFSDALGLTSEQVDDMFIYASDLFR